MHNIETCMPLYQVHKDTAPGPGLDIYEEICFGIMQFMHFLKGVACQSVPKNVYTLKEKKNL